MEYESDMWHTSDTSDTSDTCETYMCKIDWIMDKTMISELGKIINTYFVTYNTPLIDLILDT